MAPTGGLDGAVEVNVIDCDAGPAATTFTLWVIRGAALKLALPAWSARMTHDPVPMKVTRLAAPIEHSVLEDGAIVRMTGRPDVAVAVGV